MADLENSVTCRKIVLLTIKALQTQKPTPVTHNKKPRGFMQSCFPFLCILNVVVIFYYIFY